jgi:hypothetical protein
VEDQGPVGAVMALSLLYHDVVESGSYDSSGFPGGAAARYKLSLNDFRKHLAAIGAVVQPGAVPTFTFDDGGSSSCLSATELERLGWLGCFLVTTDRIGSPGFLDAAQIRDLRARGHEIGTHTCSHPARISACGREQLMAEWSESRRLLEEILGERVTTGSVPGGYYSSGVAAAAATSGLRLLYTSEPTQMEWDVAGCRVVGRYTIYRGTSARAASALVSARSVARIVQAAVWRTKKVVKQLSGPAYPRIRSAVLERLYLES